jgi:hypothetical protein
MRLENLAIFLDGGRVVFSLIITLAFWRLGRATRDRLYHAFAIAFFLMAVSSTLLGLGIVSTEWSFFAFVPRLFAFLVIIWAIIDKNRRAPKE